jgi:pimeloyl-[acyl-carrier protein] methyl ester esterase
MTTLVLLPGMDGTGELFSPLLDVLESKAQVVRYPASASLGYAELTAFARAALPVDEPYVLLGESFSGPVAIQLAASRPKHLVGMVLCCSFARNPRPSLGWLRGATGFLPARPPLKAIEVLLCGRFASPRLRAALAQALAQVPPAVLRARIAAVLSVDVVNELKRVDVPVLYLRALEDRLVPKAAGQLVVQNSRHIRVAELVAPHFLLQTVPREAVIELKQFMEETVSAG